MVVKEELDDSRCSTCPSEVCSSQVHLPSSASPSGAMVEDSRTTIQIFPVRKEEFDSVVSQLRLFCDLLVLGNHKRKTACFANALSHAHAKSMKKYLEENFQYDKVDYATIQGFVPNFQKAMEARQTYRNLRPASSKHTFKLQLEHHLDST